MPFAEIMSKAPEIIECVANRGTKYRVAFDHEGNAVWVETVYRRAADTGSVRRRIWSKHCERMSTTAACAIRSAIAVKNPSALDKALASIVR